MYRRTRGPVSELPMYASDAHTYDKTGKPRGSARNALLGRLCLGIAVIGLLTFALIGWWLSTPIIKAYRTSRSADHPSERTFMDANGTAQPFPSIWDAPELRLSVVVPAYNEEQRMPAALDEMIAALTTEAERDKSFTWEILVVDDGSKDGTAALAHTYTRTQSHERVRLLKLAANSGKGAAVRKGVARARGSLVLMADADGATRAADFTTLMAQLEMTSIDGRGVAIGSRAHMEEESASSHTQAGTRVQRSGLRRFLMWGFHTFVSFMIGGAGIKDTQCGFKMFTRAAARELFGVLHIERWAFDVELVFLAARKGIPMVEVPVTWKEMPGSKVDIASASIQMARDIIVIRLCYMLGIWKDTVQAPPPTRAQTPMVQAAEAGDAPDAAADNDADTAKRPRRRPRERYLDPRKLTRRNVLDTLDAGAPAPPPGQGEG